jgi:ABC-type transport system substrate-binding protein
MIVRPILGASAHGAELRTSWAPLIKRVPVERARELANDPVATIVEPEEFSKICCLVNPTKKPFDDVRVRRALNYGDDREVIVKHGLDGRSESGPVP